MFSIFQAMVNIFNTVKKGFTSLMTLPPTAAKDGVDVPLTPIAIYALFLSYSLTLIFLFALRSQ